MWWNLPVPASQQPWLQPTKQLFVLVLVIRVYCATCTLNMVCGWQHPLVTLQGDKGGFIYVIIPPLCMQYVSQGKPYIHYRRVHFDVNCWYCHPFTLPLLQLPYIVTIEGFACCLDKVWLPRVYIHSTPCYLLVVSLGLLEITHGPPSRYQEDCDCNNNRFCIYYALVLYLS